MTTTLIKTASTGHIVTVTDKGWVQINGSGCAVKPRNVYSNPDSIPAGVAAIATDGKVQIALTDAEYKALLTATATGKAAYKTKCEAINAKERAYDNLHNEGGEGYNPHRVASFERPDGLDSY